MHAAADLSPFEPSRERPWDDAAVGHLVRRAGFLPTLEERRDARARGPRDAVDALIDAAETSSRHDEIDDLGEGLARRNDIGALRGWWLMRMRYTTRPLHTRMTLFWHDHFATSNAKVQSAAMMYSQLRLFEKHALGSFGDLVRGITRDPAMIVWLDSEDNVRGRPNENYARELFELFTLGVGNYTESDIREAARALTGWRQRNGRSQFVARNHDAGDKTVLGTTGRLDADAVVDLALARPACGTFLATRLLEAFVTPSPHADLVSAVAAHLRDNGFDVATTLRTLLKSNAMFAPEHYRARIKSPVEYAIGLARSLELKVSGPDLADATSRMGQRLLEPPTVKGWDGDRTWLNSATMLVRLNTVTAALDDGQRFDPDRLALGDDAFDALTQLTLDGRIGDTLRARLDRLKGHDVRAALRLLLASPEYHLS